MWRQDSVKRSSGQDYTKARSAVCTSSSNLDIVSGNCSQPACSGHYNAVSEIPVIFCLLPRADYAAMVSTGHILIRFRVVTSGKFTCHMLLLLRVQTACVPRLLFPLDNGFSAAEYQR